MPELPSNILTSLTNIPHNEKLAKAAIQPVDVSPNESFDGGDGVPWAQNERESAIALQYWPETLSDSRGSEWNPRPIAGGSHPIYQWSSGGERRLSFTAMFTTDTKPQDGNLGSGTLESQANAVDRGRVLTSASIANYGTAEIQDAYPETTMGARLGLGLEIGVRDIDLRAVVSWLRWYTYPDYSTEDQFRAYEPAKVLLVMPNTGLGFDGSDHVLTVMTQCDVTYEEWFPNGFPRTVEISLEFAEVVQSGNRVQFHSRRLMRNAHAKNIRRYLALQSREL